MADEFLRSLLFVPGNSPALIQSAPYLGADAIILDLEDAVAPTEKDAARSLVASALDNLNFKNSTVVVRVNGLDTPYGHRDIRILRKHKPAAILLPKATTGYVAEACGLLEGSDIQIICLLESALGVETAFQIATLSSRVRGLFFGAEDFTADMGIARTPEGAELSFARGRVALAARAAGIEAVDTPFTDIEDIAGFLRDVAAGQMHGFTGKALISPRHIAPLHEALRPQDNEVAYARRILKAAEDAFASGVGVFNMDGKMVDAPIINRAKRTIALANRYGGESIE